MGELREIEVMAEYASSGIWARGNFGPFRHGMVRHESLNLPSDLSERFRAWIRVFEDGVSDIESFDHAGRKLAEDLQAFLGASYRVTYTSERELRDR